MPVDWNKWVKKRNKCSRDDNRVFAFLPFCLFTFLPRILQFKVSRIRIAINISVNSSNETQHACIYNVQHLNSIDVFEYTYILFRHLDTVPLINIIPNLYSTIRSCVEYGVSVRCHSRIGDRGSTCECEWIRCMRCMRYSPPSKRPKMG